MTSAAASPPRTSSRITKRKQLKQKQEMNAAKRAVAANPLGDPPALTVARYPDFDSFFNAVIFQLIVIVLFSVS